MARRYGSDAGGSSFTQATIDAVWRKGLPYGTLDKAQYRMDVAGNKICKSSYGLASPMGWEIDHKRPVSKGGSDDLSNLQPLQTAENRSKGDTYPWP